MRKIIVGTLLIGPLAVFAATPFDTTLDNISDYISLLIPILLTLAVVVFFWGLVKFIASASDEAAHENGKNIMIWGMIALFVMVSFWGILGYVEESVGLDQGQLSPANAPSVQLVPGT